MKERFNAPVNMGEEYDVKIENTDRDGDGIAVSTVCDFCIRAPKVGDEVKIR
jgi:predicted RNA-binding protein with TRAM domain